MTVLITGASGRLGQAIAAELGSDHELRLMDTGLLSREDCDRAVHGVHAVIHTAEPPAELPGNPLEREQRLLDFWTRGTHTLLSAAIAAGVQRIVYAGTLSIFRAYPDDVYLTELWKPLPSPEMADMGRYLGEIVCREFARDYPITATSLRLGELVVEEEITGQTPNLFWLDVRDAAQAFRCALQRDQSGNVWWTRRWDVVHVCAEFPNPKFLIGKASRMGFHPAHNFARG